MRIGKLDFKGSNHALYTPEYFSYDKFNACKKNMAEFFLRYSDTNWKGTGIRTFFKFKFLKINSVESGHHVSYRVNETTKPETDQGSKG